MNSKYVLYVRSNLLGYMSMWIQHSKVVKRRYCMVIECPMQIKHSRFFPMASVLAFGRDLGQFPTLELVGKLLPFRQVPSVAPGLGVGKRSTKVNLEQSLLCKWGQCIWKRLTVHPKTLQCIWRCLAVDAKVLQSISISRESSHDPPMLLAIRRHLGSSLAKVGADIPPPDQISLDEVLLISEPNSSSS